MSEELIAQLKTDSRFRDLDAAELERIANLYAKLRGIELFHSLSDLELAFVTQAGHEIHCERGDTIIQQNDTDRAFYVVLSGQLRVWRWDEEGNKQLLNYSEEGDYCGEMVFFDQEVRTANVDVMDDADLVAFGPEGVKRILQHSTIKDYLQKWAEDRTRRNEIPFEGKQPDEITLVAARKNWLALARMLIFPVAVVLLTLITVVLLSTRVPIRQDVATSVTLAIVVGMLLWSLWMWEDWRNDDFIVTSKRVIHIERFLVPPFPVERQEAAIEQVQDIETDRQGIWTILFGVNTLHIRTMSTGSIRFPYLTNVEHIREAIFHARDLARRRRSGEERSRIRDRLNAQLGLSLKQVTPLESEQELPVTPVPTGVMRLFDYFVPRMRIVERDRIIWRKHWFILVIKLAPVMLLLGLSVGALFLAIFWATFSLQLPWYLTVPLPAMAVLYCMVWVLWRYEAWRNDVYIVTSERIIDIEGTPFHLFKETRTEGPFDVIQNIDYRSKNWFYRLLHLGDVTIDTAAKQDAYTFDLVSRPEEVQQEIFRRWVAYRERKRRQETEQRYSEFARWFEAYHHSVIERRE